MLINRNWHSAAAVVAALGMIATTAVSWLSTSVAASEQAANQTLLSQSRRTIIPAGTIIPISYDQGQRIIVTPSETASFTLTVATDIFDSRGRFAIPEGSLIEGELQPAPGGGTYYVARELILFSPEERFPIDATSEIITQTTTVSRRSNPNIFRGAAIGAAAAAIISELIGDIDLLEVLAGAGVGIIAELLINETEEVEVVVVEPERDLDLTLESDLLLN